MITRNHVQQLLDRPEEDARLVVVAGEALVVSADSLDEDRYRGALEVTSRHAIADQLSPEAADSLPALEEIAARLDTELTQLGG